MTYFIFLLYSMPFLFFILNISIIKFKIYNDSYKSKIKIRNIPSIYLFFPFILFNILTLILYILYSIVFFIYFLLKFFRYQKNFKRNITKIYFKKFSLYFNFWRYLHIYLKKYVYIMFLIIKNIIYTYFFKYIKTLQLKFILNFYFKYYYINFLLYFSSKFFLYYLLINVWLKKLIYNFYNFDDFRFMFWFKKDFNKKYQEDPILYRNAYLKFSTLLYKLYPFFYLKNEYNFSNKKNIYLKNIILIYFLKLLNIIFLIINKYWILNHLLIISYLLIIKNYIFKYFKLFFLLIINYIILLIIYLYIFILNLIYFIIIINIYFFYLFIKYIYIIINNNINLIKYILLFIILIYFSWLINYYLIILYKHYMLYFPLFNLKNNYRLFNFDWIDLSNYYTLISFRNNLIDIKLLNNNLLFNNLLKELNIKLNLFGFKFTPKLNMSLYTLNHYEILQKNKDNLFFYNIFSKYNNSKGYVYIKQFKNFRRHMNNLFRYNFNNQAWHKSQQELKKKNGNIPFNTHRLKEELTQKKVKAANAHLAKSMMKWPLNDTIKDMYMKKHTWYRLFKRKNINTTKIRFYINKYIKLKNVPLKHIFINYRLKFLNKYFLDLNLLKKENVKKLTYLDKFSKRLSTLKFFFNLLNDITKQQFFNKNKKIAHFKIIYRKYVLLHKDFLLKNKIPTYLFTEQRRKRFGPLVIPLKKRDLTSASNVPVMSQYKLYRDISRYSQKIKLRYNYQWILRSYPYRISNYNSRNYKFAAINYYNLLNTGIKLTKKYYFFKNSRIYKFNKLYIRLISSLDLIYFNQLKKFKYWKKAFFLNTLNSDDSSFWGFFDQLKYRKYSHDKNYINGFLITHWKKDYHHMRFYLIRSLSILRFYQDHNKIKDPWIHLNFLSKDATWDSFRSFQYRWHFKEFLFANENYDQNIKNIRFMAKLFIDNFKNYYLEYFKINKYNVNYKIKINSYKLKVLRKIHNINRFFYFRNKISKGWKIFNYLNTFSINFHIKHLLWHSPYSFWLFNNNLSTNNIFDIKQNKLYYNYCLYNYNYNNINTLNYSNIFNLYLNVFEIKEDWAYSLFNNKTIKKDLFSKSFFYYFNYGNFFYYNLNQLEGYRLLIPLIKNYYDSFLLKLIRYRYVWDYKNLNFYIFIKRSLISFINSLYFKIRIHIYYYHDTYSKIIEKQLNRILKKRFYIKYKKGFIPFWFVFDYHIKVFFKYLFKYYYIQNNYCIWWLKYRLNYNFFFFFLLKILSYYYNQRLKLNNNFNLFINSVYNNIILDFYDIIYYYININLYDIIYYYNNIIFYIYLIIYIIYKYYLTIHNYIIYLIPLIKLEPFLCWYKDILSYSNNYNFYINITRLKYNNILLIYNLLIYNLFFILRKYIFNIYKFSLDFKNFIFWKWNLQISLKNYITMFFNIKNKLVYFKSNYYYFKYTNLMSRKKKRHTSHTLYSFLITKPKFNWHSLRTKSSAFYSYKKFTLFNLRSFFYIYNSYDIKINIANFFAILFYPFIFIKYKIFDFNNIYIYFIFYIMLLLITVIISKQFYKTLFIVKQYDKSNELDWVLFKNNNVIKFVKYSNDIKVNFFKNLIINKKIKNLTDLIFLLSPLKQIYKKNWWLGMALYNKFLKNLYISSKVRSTFDQYYNNLPYYNVNLNNDIFYDNNNTHKFLKTLKMYDLKFNFFYKFLNEFYMNFFFTIKKENRKYNFYQSNLYFNFPFGFLYWILFVPYFFYAYILSKYHIRFSPSKRRRLYYLFKALFFDNLKIFIYLNKYLNRKFIRKFYRSKRPKTHDLVYWNRKRLKKNLTPKRHLWYRLLYIRLSGLGDYYFWFARINFFKYKVSYINFFFNSILKSLYFCWFFMIYILLILYCLHNFKNACKLKIKKKIQINLNFIKIFNLLIKYIK